ncbi:MAG TPA: hypothetical protein VHX37_00135 [Acidobacteriaceae bacterium]|jgi:hypothetical protein|nr:hypothetical protein [Acidobacteriaceae bacterium]
MTACRGKIGVWLTVAACMLAAPAAARADAGIPMMPLPYPTFLWFLPAVIVLEVIYVLSELRVPWGRAVLALTAANAATTGLGFPLTWGVYNLLRMYAGFPTAASGAFTDMQFVPLWMCMRLFPDWVGTHQELGVILAIYVTLLVPSYLISRMLKTWVIDWYDLLACDGKSRSVMLGANRASYALLAVTGCALLVKAYHG